MVDEGAPLLVPIPIVVGTYDWKFFRHRDGFLVHEREPRGHLWRRASVEPVKGAFLDEPYTCIFCLVGTPRPTEPCPARFEEPPLD